MDVFEQGLFYENNRDGEFANFLPFANIKERFTGAITDFNSYWTEAELKDRFYLFNQINDEKQKEDYSKIVADANAKFVTINDPDIKKEFLDELSQLQKQNSELLSKATTDSEKNKYRALAISYRGLVRRVKGERARPLPQPKPDKPVIIEPVPNVRPSIPLLPPAPQPIIYNIAPEKKELIKEEQKKTDNKNMLYIGLGVGALVIIGLMFKRK